MEHIEYEERVMISESDYHKIIEDIKQSEKPYVTSLIENIYLDNRDLFIYKNKMMLRIRTTNGDNQELTLKVRNPDGSTREINETLSHHPIINELLNNEFESYKEITRLITYRIEIFNEDYTFVLDKNEYENTVDYNIEIEANSQQNAIKLINYYCQKYNLKYSKDYEVKSHRAIKIAIKKMKGDN